MQDCARLAVLVEEARAEHLKTAPGTQDEVMALRRWCDARATFAQVDAETRGRWERMNTRAKYIAAMANTVARCAGNPVNRKTTWENGSYYEHNGFAVLSIAGETLVWVMIGNNGQYALVLHWHTVVREFHDGPWVEQLICVEKQVKLHAPSPQVREQHDPYQSLNIRAYQPNLPAASAPLSTGGKVWAVLIGLCLSSTGIGALIGIPIILAGCGVGQSATN
jgi:hypothetical protein